MGRTIYLLQLQEDGNPPFGGTGISLPVGAVLRFVLPAGSRICLKEPKIFTNVPMEDKSIFDRNRFHEVESPAYDGKKDWFADVVLQRAGAFDYYLLWHDKDEDELDEHRSDYGHFVVEPTLTIGSKQIKSSELCMQTVLTRCLGPVDTWSKHFETAARLGFNAIHFTPVQQLGQSGSSYSLYDQLTLSDLNFRGSEADRDARLASELKRMEEEFGILGFVDIVLNHTANNSPWLHEHPEATYNLRNCPYLTPAFLVDNALQKLSADLIAGTYKQSHGVDGNVSSEADIAEIVNILRNDIIPSLKLWEFYTINVEQALQEFQEEVSKNPAEAPTVVYHDREIEVLRREGISRDQKWGRHSLRVNVKWAVKLFGVVRVRPVDPKRVAECMKGYQRALDIINLPLYEQLNDHINAICRNVSERIRYERLASHGPALGPLSENHPLVSPYFTAIKKGDQISTWCINNGWVWGGNPLENFASAPGFAYLRRDVIIWSDSVKLRFGKGPEECPWLWMRMREYVQRMAKFFHGIRIDNCHSTPLHVARFLLDAAREVRPNIYVIAELFTGNERYDNIFISKLGINALIREAMSAYDSHELGRLCHRYGGEPVGSIVKFYPPIFYDDKGQSADIILPAKPGTPPAVFFDCTHDNETPVQKRTAHDALTNSTLVWSAGCPVGTTFGYDMLIPKHIPVTEHRLYPFFQEKQYDGIMKARKTLNDLHQRLAGQGFSEIHVHQEGELITIQRHSPRTHRAVFFIAHSAFSPQYRNDKPASVRIPGRVLSYLFAGRLASVNSVAGWSPGAEIITGLGGEFQLWKEPMFNQIFEVVPMETEPGSELRWVSFPPGSVLIVEAGLPAPAEAALKLLSTLDSDASRLFSLFSDLELQDFNYLLFSCDSEERSHSNGSRGVYSLPNHGPLTYAGMQGWISVLEDIRVHNDMGHSLFDNLRTGNWAMDYLVDRLSAFPSLAGVQRWLADMFAAAQQLPRYLIPKYFDKIVTKVYLSARQYIFRQMMSQFVWKSDDSFVRDLALTAVQMMGSLNSVSLINASLASYPKTLSITMAAGLPHFSSGFMRAWGRDTFIALPGLLLVTGRFDEARELLVGFASAVRHGLIPNLLDSGFNPRFNCRDASWWFLQSVQEYCDRAPRGIQLLQENVIRLFPEDSSYHDNTPRSDTCKFAVIVQEILQRHAAGINFRERNAGSQIDAHMRDRGFDISIRLDIENGLIYGGNEYNCGTWMDKMGESDLGHNRGVPATPRDGADVEIIGLLKSALRWLANISLSHPDLYPFTGVTVPSATGPRALSFAEWGALVQENFEQFFWVPFDPKLDSKYKVDKALIHKRGIYKDVVGSQHRFTDYQLRPNYVVAMAVAPELFSPEKALKALEIIEKHLLGPLGLKTLDPADRQYRPNYESGQCSDDYFTSGGFNYHNGPEWLWPLGYFLRAKLNFSPASVSRTVLADTMQRLTRKHREVIRTSHWRGLPELTNENGSLCRSSCATQAWSSGTLLQAFYELYKEK